MAIVDPTSPQHTRATKSRQAVGSEEAFESYLRDISGFGLLGVSSILRRILHV